MADDTPTVERERLRRIAEAKAEATRLRNDPATPRVCFFLSFADNDGFRGGCIIDDVVNFADAITQAHLRGCNPGGEVQAIEVPSAKVPSHFPRNVLLNREAWMALDDMPPELPS